MLPAGGSWKTGHGLGPDAALLVREITTPAAVIGKGTRCPEAELASLVTG